MCFTCRPRTLTFAPTCITAEIVRYRSRPFPLATVVYTVIRGAANCELVAAALCRALGAAGVVLADGVLILVHGARFVRLARREAPLDTAIAEGFSWTKYSPVPRLGRLIALNLNLGVS